MRVRFFCINICILFFFSLNIHAKSVGSNTAPSRQARAFFPKTDGNNIILGFSACDKGITLDDITTSCSYDSYFPLVGDIVLNGGSLWLMRDLMFNSPLNLGVGKIGGNGFAIEFPRSVSNVDIPAKDHQYIIQLVNQVSLQKKVNALDWSYDDQYIAAVTDGALNGPELHIIRVAENVLTVTATYDLGVIDVNTVAWQPGSHYLAIGASGGDELQTFLFNDLNADLSLIDSVNIGTVMSIAWHPTGNWLTVGKAVDNNLYVYPVTNGILNTPITVTLGAKRKILKNALDWDYTGTYLAVGHSRFGRKAEIEIFAFDGEQLSHESQVVFSFFTDINVVKWLPKSNLLSCGLNAGVQRLRIYEHKSNSGALTERTSGRINELRTIFDVAWHADKQFFSSLKSKDKNAHEIEMYVFNQDDVSLHLINGYEIDKNVQSLVWLHQGKQFATSTASNNIGLFNLVQQQLSFENVELFFSSDVTVHHQIDIFGSCLINCKGRIFDLKSTSSLLIKPGATLQLEDVKIKGIAGQNIRCEEETGKLILRNVNWIQEENFQFKKGSIEFYDDVLLGGDGTVFAYQTNKTSTINAKSKVTLDVGLTFSYDPPVDQGSQKLLKFIDKSSQLTMDGATLHVTMTGIELLNGKLKIIRDSFFASEISSDGLINNGITFGNHVSANDMLLEILSGSILIVTQGALNYRNVNTNALSMVNQRAIIKINDNAQLNIYEKMWLGDGIITFDNATLARLVSTNIMGSINTRGTFNQILMD